MSKNEIVNMFEWRIHDYFTGQSSVRLSFLVEKLEDIEAHDSFKRIDELGKMFINKSDRYGEAIIKEMMSKGRISHIDQAQDTEDSFKMIDEMGSKYTSRGSSHATVKELMTRGVLKTRFVSFL